MFDRKVFDRKTTFCSVCGEYSTVVHPCRFRRMACACGKTHLVCGPCFCLLKGDRTMLDTKRGRQWLLGLSECPRTKDGQKSLRVVMELMR